MERSLQILFHWFGKHFINPKKKKSLHLTIVKLFFFLQLWNFSLSTLFYYSHLCKIWPISMDNLPPKSPAWWCTIQFRSFIEISCFSQWNCRINIIPLSVLLQFAKSSALLLNSNLRFIFFSGRNMTFHTHNDSVYKCRSVSPFH